MPKLTKTVIDNEQPGPDERVIWDSSLKGFGIRIHPSGAKTFIYTYRNREGRARKATIGKYCDALTPTQARERAEALYRDVIDGKDPQGIKRARKSAPTLDSVFDDYMQSTEFKDKAATTQATDLGRINHHLRPLLGKVFADKLTTDDVKQAVKQITEGKTAARIKTKARGLARIGGGPGTAKKAFNVLRAICKWSTQEGTPAGVLVDWTAIKVKADGQRETILEDASAYKVLFDTLDTMQSELRVRREVADAIRVIALTGARRNEIAGLRWRHVDAQRGRLVLMSCEHKTGHRSGRDKIIALPAAVLEIILRQPAGEPDDYVFRPARGVGPLALNKPWRDIRAEAGLPEDLVLHGLRHSVGSHLAMAGASLPEIMAVLGHTDPKTSVRYVHIADSAKNKLAERAASVALAGLNGTTEKADVIPLTKKAGSSK